MEAASPVNLKEANETLSAGERTVSQPLQLQATNDFLTTETTTTQIL